MAKGKSEGRPVWFKIYADMAASIMEVPSKTVGDVIKALFLLLEDDAYEPAFKSVPARILYNQMRRGVLEAKADYERIVENSRKASRARWDKAAVTDAACMQDASDTMQPYAEQEPEPYPEQEQKQDLYPERKEEQEPFDSSSFLPEEYDPNVYLPWELRMREMQMEALRKGEITVDDLIRFPPDVVWPPECARNYV